MKMKVNEVLDILALEYPNPKSELDYDNTFNLLIAVVLSAQATDVSVNKVTPILFAAYPDAYSLARANREDVMEILKTIGLYRNKSKFIIEASKKIVADFQGKVPGTREELMTLPGVGRKTANVVLSNAFNVPSIAVDTHVFRVSNRIGLANAKNVFDTEKQLMENIDKDMWSKAHHLLIFHGRRICKARNPMCEECPVNELCLYYKNEVLSSK